jgi:hypothetical protein
MILAIVGYPTVIFQEDDDAEVIIVTVWCAQDDRDSG